AEARADDVLRPVADDRGLDAGVDRQCAVQAVDEAHIEGELLAATPLLARVEEQFDEPLQGRCRAANAGGMLGMMERRRTCTRTTRGTLSTTHRIVLTGTKTTRFTAL